MEDYKVIYINDKLYPKKLLKIKNPPQQLYVMGNIELLNKDSIAIIGSRKCTDYGEKQAAKFSRQISNSDVCIVSGLAKGIDSYAHLGALSVSGKTIAIIGSGIDNIYPKENIKLAENIVKNNGLIISEYPLGTLALKQNFPARNRIISGISNSILVVEAREKSGTNITVEFALEQGKDIYVIPGNIYSKTSNGTNFLIQEGAIPVVNYKDIKKKMINYCKFM